MHTTTVSQVWSGSTTTKKTDGTISVKHKTFTVPSISKQIMTLVYLLVGWCFTAFPASLAIFMAKVFKVFIKMFMGELKPK